MMEELSNDRADRLFVIIAKNVTEIRNSTEQYTKEEIAYALLQTCCAVDSGHEWNGFIKQALKECVFMES